MAEKDRLFPFFAYGRTALYDETWKARVEKLYKDFSKEAKESGNYIVGSHQQLPFADQSIDFIVANNSITNFTDKKIISSMIIKKNGDIPKINKNDGQKLRKLKFSQAEDSDLIPSEIID